MKKIRLIAGILPISLTISSSVFALGGATTLPGVGTVVPAQTTIHWEGSISDVIPGDNIIITGLNSNVKIDKGNLNLETNGTFDSTKIVLESHVYDSESQIIADDVAVATWALKSVQYTWGENIMTNAEVKVFDSLDPDNALVVDQPITNVGSMSLNVKNAKPLAPADITDKTAAANVDVTMTAAFPV